MTSKTHIKPHNSVKEEKENADKNNALLDRLNELLNKAIMNGLPEDEQEEVASLHSEYKAISDDAITESQVKLAEFAIIEMCEMLVRYKILSDEDFASYNLQYGHNKTLQEHLFQPYPTWYNIGNYSNRNTNILRR